MKRTRHISHRKEIESETQLLKKIFAWLFQAKLTVFLIAANIIIYFWSLTWSAEKFSSLMFTPGSLLSLNFMPMVSSWFLHANLTHLLGNMLFLFIFGRVAERRFGALKSALIYFGAAISSDLIAGLVFQQGGIGASGAISGLIAAAIIIDPFYFSYIVFGLPVPIVVIGWIAIFSDITGLLQPVADNIGHIAHLAGFFAITLFVYLLNREDKKIKAGFFINILTLLVVILVNYMFPGFKIKGLIK